MMLSKFFPAASAALVAIPFIVACAPGGGDVDAGDADAGEVLKVCLAACENATECAVEFSGLPEDECDAPEDCAVGSACVQGLYGGGYCLAEGDEAFCTGISADFTSVSAPIEGGTGTANVCVLAGAACEEGFCAGDPVGEPATCDVDEDCTEASAALSCVEVE